MCGVSFRCVSFTMRNVIFVLSWNITRLYRFCLMYQKLMKVSVCENLIFAMHKFHTIQKELKFIYIFGDVSINQRWNQYEVEMSKQYNIDLEFFWYKIYFLCVLFERRRWHFKTTDEIKVSEWFRSSSRK